MAPTQTEDEPEDHRDPVVRHSFVVVSPDFPATARPASASTPPHHSHVHTTSHTHHHDNEHAQSLLRAAQQRATAASQQRLAAAAPKQPQAPVRRVNPLAKVLQQVLRHQGAQDKRMDRIEGKLDAWLAEGHRTRRDVDDLIDQRDHDAHVQLYRARELREDMRQLEETTSAGRETIAYARILLNQLLTEGDHP